MMKDQEIWKKIKGYEGLYQISNLGRVKGLSKNIYRKGKLAYIRKDKILKVTINSAGYCRVNIYAYGKHKCRRVHRLVALAFIPNPENKPTVNHKRGNKLDNRASALEWATYAENNSHAYQTGLKISMLGKFGKYHIRSKPVNQYSKDGIFIERHDSQREATKKTKVKPERISGTCNGRQKSAGGYIWKFA